MSNQDFDFTEHTRSLPQRQPTPAPSPQEVQPLPTPAADPPADPADVVFQVNNLMSMFQGSDFADANPETMSALISVIGPDGITEAGLADSVGMLHYSSFADRLVTEWHSNGQLGKLDMWDGMSFRDRGILAQSLGYKSADEMELPTRNPIWRGVVGLGNTVRDRLALPVPGLAPSQGSAEQISIFGTLGSIFDKIQQPVNQRVRAALLSIEGDINFNAQDYQQRRAASDRLKGEFADEGLGYAVTNAPEALLGGFENALSNADAWIETTGITLRGLADVSAVSSFMDEAADGEGTFWRHSLNRVRAQYQLSDDGMSLVRGLARKIDSSTMTQNAEENVGIVQNALIEYLNELAPGDSEDAQMRRAVIHAGLNQRTDILQAAADLAAEGKVSFGRVFGIRMGMVPGSADFKAYSGYGDAMYNMTFDPTIALGTVRNAMKLRAFGVNGTNAAQRISRLAEGSGLVARRFQASMDEIAQAATNQLRVRVAVEGADLVNAAARAADRVGDAIPAVADLRDVTRGGPSEFMQWVNRSGDYIHRRMPQAVDAFNKFVVDRMDDMGRRISEAAENPDRIRGLAQQGIEYVSEEGGYFRMSDDFAVTRNDVVNWFRSDEGIKSILNGEASGLVHKVPLTPDRGLMRLLIGRDGVDRLGAVEETLRARLPRAGRLVRSQPTHLLPYTAASTIIPRAMKRVGAEVVDWFADTPFRFTQRLVRSGVITEESARLSGAYMSLNLGKSARIYRSARELAAEAGSSVPMLHGAAAFAASMGMVPVSAVGNLMHSVTHMVGHGPVNVMEATGASMVRRHVDMLPPSMRKHYTALYTATTDPAIRTSFLRSMTNDIFEVAGAESSKLGRRIRDNALHVFDQSNQQLFAASDDLSLVKSMSGEGMEHAAITSYDLSPLVAMPDPRETWKALKHASIMDMMDPAGAMGALSQSVMIDRIMGRIWSPLVLWKLGFAVRASGDEFGLHWLREGFFDGWFAPRNSLSAVGSLDDAGKVTAYKGLIPAFLRPDRLFVRQILRTVPMDELAQAFRLDEIIDAPHSLDEITDILFRDREIGMFRPKRTEGAAQYRRAIHTMISDGRISPYTIIGQIHGNRATRVINFLAERPTNISRAITGQVRELQRNMFSSTRYQHNAVMMAVHSPTAGRLVPSPQDMSAVSVGAKFRGVDSSAAFHATGFNEHYRPHPDHLYRILEQKGYGALLPGDPRLNEYKAVELNRAFHTPEYQVVAEEYLNARFTDGLEVEEAIERAIERTTERLADDPDFQERAAQFIRQTRVDGAPAYPDHLIDFYSSVAGSPSSVLANRMAARNVRDALDAQEAVDAGAEGLSRYFDNVDPSQPLIRAGKIGSDEVATTISRTFDADMQQAFGLLDEIARRDDLTIDRDVLDRAFRALSGEVLPPDEMLPFSLLGAIRDVHTGVGSDPLEWRLNPLSQNMRPNLDSWDDARIAGFMEDVEAHIGNLDASFSSAIRRGELPLSSVRGFVKSELQEAFGAGVSDEVVEFFVDPQNREMLTSMFSGMDNSFVGLPQQVINDIRQIAPTSFNDLIAQPASVWGGTADELIAAMVDDIGNYVEESGGWDEVVRMFEDAGLDAPASPSALADKISDDLLPILRLREEWWDLVHDGVNPFLTSTQQIPPSAVPAVLEFQGHLVDFFAQRSFRLDPRGSSVHGGKTILRSGRPAPWEMTESEFINEYERLRRRVSEAEMDPSEGNPVDLEILESQGWEEFSRLRGYTDQQIEDFRRWLELNGGDGLLDRDVFDEFVDGFWVDGEFGPSVQPERVYELFRREFGDRVGGQYTLREMFDVIETLDVTDFGRHVTLEMANAYRAGWIATSDSWGLGDRGFLPISDSSLIDVATTRAQVAEFYGLTDDQLRAILINRSRGLKDTEFILTPFHARAAIDGLKALGITDITPPRILDQHSMSNFIRHNVVQHGEWVRFAERGTTQGALSGVRNARTTGQAAVADAADIVNDMAERVEFEDIPLGQVRAVATYGMLGGWTQSEQITAMMREMGWETSQITAMQERLKIGRWSDEADDLDWLNGDQINNLGAVYQEAINDRDFISQFLPEARGSVEYRASVELRESLTRNLAEKPVGFRVGSLIDEALRDMGLADADLGLEGSMLRLSVLDVRSIANRVFDTMVDEMSRGLLEASRSEIRETVDFMEQIWRSSLLVAEYDQEITRFQGGIPAIVTRANDEVFDLIPDSGRGQFMFTPTQMEIIDRYLEGKQQQLEANPNFFDVVDPRGTLMPGQYGDPIWHRFDPSPEERAAQAELDAERVAQDDELLAGVFEGDLLDETPEAAADLQARIDAGFVEQPEQLDELTPSLSPEQQALLEEHRYNARAVDGGASGEGWEQWARLTESGFNTRSAAHEAHVRTMVESFMEKVVYSQKEVAARFFTGQLFDDLDVVPYIAHKIDGAADDVAYWRRVDTSNVRHMDYDNEIMLVPTGKADEFERIQDLAFTTEVTETGSEVLRYTGPQGAADAVLYEDALQAHRRMGVPLTENRERQIRDSITQTLENRGQIADEARGLGLITPSEIMSYVPTDETRAAYEALVDKIALSVPEELRSGFRMLVEDGGRQRARLRMPIRENLIESMLDRAKRGEEAITADELRDLFRTNELSSSYGPLVDDMGPLRYIMSQMGTLTDRAFKPLLSYIDYLSRQPMTLHYYTKGWSTAGDLFWKQFPAEKQILDVLQEWVGPRERIAGALTGESPAYNPRWSSSVQARDLISGFEKRYRELIDDAMLERALRDESGNLISPGSYDRAVLDVVNDINERWDALGPEYDFAKGMVGERNPVVRMMVMETPQGKWLVENILPIAREHLGFGEIVTETLADGSKARRLNYVSDQSILVQMLDQVKTAEQFMHDRAMEYAFTNMMKYTDSVPESSIFAMKFRTLLPFFWAEERFVKRLANSLYHSPEQFRRYQLIYRGFDTAGFIEKDDNGNAIYHVPFSQGVTEEITRALSFVFGESIELNEAGLSLDFTGKMSRIVPGIQSTGLPVPGPLMGIPWRRLRNTFPILDALEPIFGSFNSSPLVSDTDLLIPPIVQRLFGIVSGNRERAAENMAGQIFNALSIMTYNGTLPPETATIEERRDFIDRLQNMAYALEVTRSFLYLGSLAPTYPDFQDIELNQELRNLTASLGWDVGLAEFFNRNPDADVVSIFQTETVGLGSIPLTQASYRFLDDNEEFFSAHPKAASFFVPDSYREGDYHSPAMQQQRAMELRRDRGSDQSDWMESILDDFYFAAAADEYFTTRDFYEEQRELVKGTSAASDLDNLWSNWRRDYMRSHPRFQNVLESSERQERRRAVISDIRDAFADDRMPESEKADGVRYLLEAFDSYEEMISPYLNRNDTESVNGRRRAKLALLNIGERWIEQHPESKTFWQLIVLPEIRVDADEVDETMAEILESIG